MRRVENAEPRVRAALAEVVGMDESELGRRQTALTLALCGGEFERAIALVREAAADLPLTAILDDLIAVAMHNVGNLWKHDEIRVADEHAASAIASRLIGTVADAWLPRASPSRGTALLANPPSERHSIPLLMADAVLRSAGFSVIDLGVDLPLAELQSAAARHRPAMVAMSTTMTPAAEVDSSLKAIHEGHPAARVFLGGAGSAGIQPAPHLKVLSSMRELLQEVTPRKPRAQVRPVTPTRLRLLADTPATPTTAGGRDWIDELVSPESDVEHARRALLQAAEEISNSASWMWDTDSDHVVWSANILHVLGLDAADTPPSIGAFLDLVHPDDRPLVQQIIERAHDGVTSDHTYRILTPRGATRHLRAVTAARVSRPAGPVLVGWLRDITKTRGADRQIAAHVAVAEALRGWSSLRTSGSQLLEDLACALGFTRATLWVPTGDVLLALACWEQDDPEQLATEISTLRLRRGQGLAGRAWEQRRAVSVPNLLEQQETGLRTHALDRGLRGAISLPLIGANQVLAVITLAGPDVVELDERLQATLEGIAHELGTFLAGRTGELRRRVLSARELEVLQLAADGLSGPQIASRLHLSPTTIKTHFENIYTKYGVPDRVSAVAKALREGLIS